MLADVREKAPVGNHKLALNASGRLFYFTVTVLEKELSTSSTCQA